MVGTVGGVGIPVGVAGQDDRKSQIRPRDRQGQFGNDTQNDDDSDDQQG